MTAAKHSYELFLKKLGESLQEIRKECGLTQAELAQKSQRGQSAIGKLERMPSLNLPLRVIYEITETIPVSLSSLFYQTEKKIESEAEKGGTKQKLEKWSLIAKRVESLPPKKREQVAQIIEQVLSN